jgi:CheY-like chemotaxis protein
VLVFLSYRRSDSTFAAQAIRYALRLAGHTVFLDTGDIAAGEAFRDVIRESLERTDLVLSLVGPTWDTARLQHPLDPVAFELRQARFLGCSVHTVLLEDAAMPREEDLPADLRWLCKLSASAIGRRTAGQQIDALVDAVPTLAARPRGAARVLWVDDKPANNERERSMLRPDGIVFDNVVSTREAVEQLMTSTYDLVITDVGRSSSSDRSYSAGEDLLRAPVIRSGGPPVIIYAGWRALEREAELVALGARAVTADYAHLAYAVREVLGRRAREPVAEPVRRDDGTLEPPAR